MVDAIRIDNIKIGINHPVLIIAEAGVNHNGDVNLAEKMIQVAKKCGANCVKFQTFSAERLVLEKAPKAEYQLQSTDHRESQKDMLKKLELSDNDFIRLIQLCHEENIMFLSTPYNIEDVDFLNEIGVHAFKIASGQVIELHFVEYVARKRKPILLSTGMCTFAEVDEAVRVIRDTGNNDLVIFQCTTNYPSIIKDCNLRAMRTMSKAFNALVGYSDHTQSLTTSIVAIGLGACVIERHFTLDKTLLGPDHSSSLDPMDFSQLVSQLREAEMSLGSSTKMPTEIEKQNALGMRRSLVARKDINASTVLSWDNLTFKRPATGISGKYAHLLIGEKACQDIPSDTIIKFSMIK